MTTKGTGLTLSCLHAPMIEIGVYLLLFHYYRVFWLTAVLKQLGYADHAGSEPGGNGTHAA